MRLFFTSVLFLTFLQVSERATAQSLYPVSMEAKISNSSLIVEGRVVSQKSFWNDRHTMIFTANQVEVYKIFKGKTQDASIEVLTVGGTVGLDAIEASDLLVLDKGTVGVFFCTPTTSPLLSPVTGNQLLTVYASAQGYLSYDLAARKASAPFARYSSIENELYRDIVKQTGLQPVNINPSFTVAPQARPQNPLAPAITSFSPALVNAGAILDPATNLLTINGSGFGATPGEQSAVIFDDANDGYGGTPFVVLYGSSLIQSWTDNQIKIQVPSRAGSGTFQVRDQAMLTASSPTFLEVNYSISTSEVTLSGSQYIQEWNLMDDNGSGGYSIVYSTGTGGNGINLNTAPEKATFERALNTWKEVAGFNAALAGTTTAQAVAADGENVVMFDNSNTGFDPLADGVLAVCYSYISYCTGSLLNQAQKTGFDIVIRNPGHSSGSTNFTSGPCPPATNIAETDMETVLLHELGHAINLAHINDSYIGTTLPNVDPGKLMNYAIVNGVARKSPDYAAYRGALYCITPQGNTYGNCGLATTEMTPLARTVTPLDECPVSFPSVSTSPGTIVSFDLIHATSNKYGDPAYTEVNCSSTGTNVTNNAYYAIRTDEDGGDLNITVSDYTTLPAGIACTGAGARLAIYQVNACPAGQTFPSPVICRTVFRNGALSTISGLSANTNYLIYLDGISNTKASFSLTLNGSVLPVTLVNFNGVYANEKVNLSWKTSSEINSKEFQVEKSHNGIAFTQFAVIDAKGNTSIESAYVAIDERPFSGQSFYRLKMVDKDGTFTYSEIVKIKTPAKSVFFSRAFPNPTTGKLTLEVISDMRKNLSAEVLDLLGKRVQLDRINLEPGVNLKTVMVNRLAVGTYFIQLRDESGTVIGKSTFIKN